MKSLQTLMLQTAAVFPDPTQHRKKFDEEAEASMAQSWKSVGQLVPIRVWKDGDKYWVEDGERRLRVAKRLAEKEIAALIVGEGTPDKMKAIRQLIINAQRQDISVVERIRAVTHLDVSREQIDRAAEVLQGTAAIVQSMAG